MGELEGRKGAWGYVEGGMGELSECIARSARDKGVDIFTGQVISNSPSTRHLVVELFDMS